ncbi:MAG TPA: DUF433 domain-containing protein [Bacteroidales bacterium]|nr:DUF433 domain-containing protein [Bacteroidales bacterium]
MRIYKNIITIDPNVRFGKPCIKGTRITVYDILGWLAAGRTNEQILADYPELKSEHIKACLEYAAEREHKLKIAT